MTRFLPVLAAVVLATGGDVFAEPSAKPREYPFRGAAPTLQIGDAAPEFSPGRWYKRGPVAPTAERLLIVDCWATWCHWCIAGFPHLSELAKAYQGKVDVVALDVRETQKPEEVQSVVEKQGDRMSFAVASDEADRFANGWLKPARQDGLPTAFILRKGRIVWLGNPATIDAKLLDSILDDSFNVEEARKAAARSHEVREAKSEITWYLSTKDYETALKKADEALKAFPDAAEVFQPLKETATRQMAASQ